MEHLLDIIVIVEHIEHTFDFCDHFGIVDIDGVGGDHILFGGEEGVACGFKSLANGRKIGGRRLQSSRPVH